MGPRFESEFSNKTGSKYSLACSSGTAALHLAVLALGFGPKHTVIVPAITFVATAIGIRYSGATVKFCDVEKDTVLISLEHIESILKKEGDSIKTSNTFIINLKIQYCGCFLNNLTQLESNS